LDTLAVVQALFRLLELYPVSDIRVTLGIYVSFICHLPNIILAANGVVK